MQTETSWSILSSIAQAGAAIGTLAALAFLWRSSREATKQSKYQLMPVIAIKRDIERSPWVKNKNYSTIILKNIGHGLAQNIFLTFQFKEYKKEFTSVVPYLEPGKEVVLEEVLELEEQGLPPGSQFHTNYQDASGRNYQATLVHIKDYGFALFQNEEIKFTRFTRIRAILKEASKNN